MFLRPFALSDTVPADSSNSLMVHQLLNWISARAWYSSSESMSATRLSTLRITYG